MSSDTPQGGADNVETKPGFSRRTFLQGVGAGAGAVGVLVPEAQAQSTAASVPVGPGPVPISLRINGKEHKVELEPRVTLLDALRNRLDYTGAKKVCDRATCGACTVIVDNAPVYACTMLAIEAEGRDIRTIEGISTSDDDMHPIQAAFVKNDGQQCGFCTPGFIMAAKAFADTHDEATMDEVENGLCGNICRCGTYMGVRQAVYDVVNNGGGNAD